MPLSPAQVATAVKWNPVYGQQVGWMGQYERVLKVLGFPNTCPTGEAFAQGVADWQARRTLKPDGMIGPNTWKKLEPEVRKVPGGAPVPVPPPAPTPPPTGAGPVWLQYAQAEETRWTDATAGWSAAKAAEAEKHLDWDEDYFKASPYFGGKSHVDGTIPGTKNLHWCAAFVNWCLHRAGYSHTGSAGAASFIGKSAWRFEALAAPRQGCVIVTGSEAAVQHVTFLWSWTTTKGGAVTNVQTLGGNQGDRVKKSGDGRKRYEARGQNGVTSPWLWPLRGEDNCTIASVPKDQGHHCGIKTV